MKLDLQTYRFKETGIFGSVALAIGLLGLATSAVGYFTETTQFFHSWLVAFMFWLSIGLGGLFFTMLHHLVNAQWSTVLRRWSESAMATLPLMSLFVIPILLGMHDLYHWSHADIVAHDEILQGKAAYLNPTFFVIRSIGYFVIWTILAVVLHRISLKQDDEHSSALSAKFRKISAPGMILFAMTITFASFDWIMSLDAHWYSTIFGVYIFSGSFIAILSFMILIGLYQRRQAILHNQVTIEHYHDIGRLMFSFVIFWAYMGFSQYFLMWYANIPEETVWFYHRWYSDWRPMSLVIIFGHFVIPFIVLITRAAKRKMILLGTVSVWLLVMRWVDLYWLVFPNLHEHGPHFSWIDLSTMAGIGGIFIWYFWKKYTSHAVVPVGDPTLEKSTQFQNV